MAYTLDDVFKSPKLIGFIVDRILADSTDPVLWTRLLRPRVTTTRIFKSSYGTKSVVRMASVIDGLSKKPLRSRKGLGESFLEVIPMGNKFQLENDRLQQIQDLIDIFNANGIDFEEFVNNLLDDFHELVLGPDKRMDRILVDLMFNGTASVNLNNNPDGVEIADFSIPIETTSVSGGLLIELAKLRNEYRRLRIGAIEMSEKTFFERFATNSAFKSELTSDMGAKKVKVTAGGLLTVEDVNAYFSAMKLPQVNIIDGVTYNSEGVEEALAPDNKIVLRPSGFIGNMRWHTPYELKDRVTAKTYFERPYGGFISSIRNDEGRFLENGFEWVPEITVPKQIVSVDISRITG